MNAIRWLEEHQGVGVFVGVNLTIIILIAACILLGVLAQNATAPACEPCPCAEAVRP